MRNKEAMESSGTMYWMHTFLYGSDHSPAADEEKDNATKDIWHAWVA